MTKAAIFEPSRREQLSERDKGLRRGASLGLFKEYLLTDQGRVSEDLLIGLGYTSNQIEFVAPVVNYLALPHTAIARGLQARPSQASESSSISLVESPRVGIAEFTATLPGKLAWQARGRMPDAEIEELVNMGALMRLTIVDPSYIDTTDPKKADRDLARALHAGDELPKFGLWEESWTGAVLREAKLAATYQASYLANSDFRVSWQMPGERRKLEIWRPLPDEVSGLRAYGCIPFNPA